MVLYGYLRLNSEVCSGWWPSYGATVRSPMRRRQSWRDLYPPTSLLGISFCRWEWRRDSDGSWAQNASSEYTHASHTGLAGTARYPCLYSQRAIGAVLQSFKAWIESETCHYPTQSWRVLSEGWKAAVSFLEEVMFHKWSAEPRRLMRVGGPTITA